MEISALYATAKNYIEKIKQEQANFALTPDCRLTLVVADNQEIFSGITGIRVREGNIEKIYSAYNAVSDMIVEENVVAKQMITVRFDDMTIEKPSDACIDLLFRASSRNARCEIVVSETE